MGAWFGEVLYSTEGELTTGTAELIVVIGAEDTDFIKTEGDEFEGEVAAVDASDGNSNEEADEEDEVGEWRAKGGRTWEGRELVECQRPVRGESLSELSSFSSSSVGEAWVGNEEVEKPSVFVAGLLLG